MWASRKGMSVGQLPLVVVGICVTVGTAVYTFVHISLLANVHCNQSVISLVQGLWLTATLSKLGPHQDYSVVALCHGDPTTLDLQD